MLGDSFNLELLEYTNRSVEVPNMVARPADPGGWHLCLHVDDIHAANAELVARPDTHSISEIIREEGDPMDGLLWTYLRTDFGLVLELIQWQPGLRTSATPQCAWRCRDGRPPRTPNSAATAPIANSALDPSNVIQSPSHVAEPTTSGHCRLDQGSPVLEHDHMKCRAVS